MVVQLSVKLGRREAAVVIIISGSVDGRLISLVDTNEGCVTVGLDILDVVIEESGPTIGLNVVTSSS